MDEITRQVSQEARTAFQTSVQVARFLADLRRRRLEQARRASAEQETRIRRAVAEQRRLADPVLRRGLDDRFWQAAQPTDAAYVYGVATRFRDVDPLAAQAAHRCRDEARQRWDLDLDAPAPPVRPDDVDDATLAAVAPVVPGEEDRDPRQDLADSAREAQQEDRTQAASLPRTRDQAQGSRPRGEAGVGETGRPSLGEVAAPLVLAGSSVAAATAVWDSPQARAAWADGLLARGHDPAVVQAALAGDRALHEPAHRATAPSTAPSTSGRPPAAPGQAHAHRHHT